MWIEELVLQGFKSFAERTVLPLLPGVTAVVGPNGSGKSNLVEAIRFAVGARTHRLRGEGPRDLVFQGGPGRRPAGFAEVRLLLAGPRRVQIARRIYADGRQEVRLDGRRATLKEVALALSGSGLGPSGAAIIGQGQVAGVVEAEPAKLFGFLVEAAGLAEVEARIREAELRLSRAEARLLEELERLERARAEVRELARAAEAARRARELEAERLALKRGILAERLERARAASEEALARAERLRREAEALSQLARALELESAFLERRFQAIKAEEAELSKLKALALAEERALARERDLLVREARLFEGRLAELEAALAALPPAPAEPAPAESPAAIAKRIEELRRRLAERRRDLAAREAAYRRYLEARARHQASLEARERWLAARREAARRLWALEDELARLLPELEAQRSRFKEHQQRRRAVLAELERVRAERRAAEAERRRLERARAEGEGLAEGSRALLAAGLPGVLGAVAELLRFPPELKAAAEAALGGRLSWVVVEDEAALKAAVAWLKARGYRATLLARALARPPKALPVPPCPGVRGRLRDALELAGDERLLRTVVGETLLAEDLDAALACFRRYPRRIVTLGGELLEPSGAVSGGRPRRHGALAVPARLGELEAELAALAAREEELARRLEALGEPPDPAPLAARVRALFQELELLHRLLAEPEPELVPEPEPVPEPRAEELGELEAELERLSRELELARAWERYREASERAPAWRRELEERRGELERVRRRLAELEARLLAERARRQRVEGLASLSRAAAGELARARERVLAERSRLAGRRERLLAEAQEARVRAARHEAQAEALARELAELPPGPARPGGLGRLREVERELLGLGPVNFRAELELRAKEEALREAEAAHADAEAAVQRLKGFLHGLREEYRERLGEAERRLDAAFARYVEALLGGRGRVRREGEGLGLELAPGGKKVRSLRLLSTGEKTMGALALLFALAEVREGGLPIAVLDEVDAALDEANLGRFAEFLARFKKGRQVLIVTHQKRTLEAADAVIGVTSSGGVSRVYTIRR